MNERSNRAGALFNHILALERLQDAKDEAGQDYNERKKLAKEDGFDANVLEAIKKRRKNGEGQTRAFDDLLSEYEMMIEQQERASNVSVTVTVHEQQSPVEQKADLEAVEPVPTTAEEEASEPVKAEHVED